ncbi:MAG: glycosyltransferase family 4 protein [Moraxellaceae bacterium]|nr:glycosyltransferase family 4 protein [Moraxellaceae bacterium]MDZ4385603.1 glycosyltransferase family 4 protein [Moraxellaceae bacterium]
MSKHLTVLQTLPALNSGGVERGTLEIARALVAAGHRSIVVSNGGRLVEQLINEGSEHITLPVHKKSLLSLFQVRPFRRLLADIKPDIVHARSRVPAWLAWLALRKMNPANRPRFVTTVHGLYSVSPYSAIMTKGERVIVVSETVRDYVLKNYPSCPPERIQLIYRGVDEAEFPYGYQPSPEWLAQWQKAFPELEGKTVLALPGRLSRVKGHETFLQLIAALKDEFPQVHGLIIGGAEPKKAHYGEWLKNEVITRGLADKISFTGHRSDMRDVLSQCNVVFALRVTPEAFGRTTLEPLRMGIPVIGWDVGGTGEILRSVFPEGLVTQVDLTVLAERVRSFLSKPKKPSESGTFPLHEMCRATLKTYEYTVLSPAKAVEETSERLRK